MSTESAGPRPPAPDYGIIFNNDGGYLKHAEACKLADWDGVELDWQRHAFHLPEEDAYRLRYTLTDLQGAVRRLTDAIAEQRGRPFHVIVRVGASRETNRRVGYDLEAWIEEGLCDIVVTGANSGTDPGVEVEAYVEMMRGTQVRLYPGFDSHGEWGREHLLPAEQWREAWFRGLATGFYERGATGVHLFNWHNHVHAVRPLLQSLGAPDSLRRTAKVYAAVKPGASCATVPSGTTACAARCPSICCAP